MGWYVGRRAWWCAQRRVNPRFARGSCGMWEKGGQSSHNLGQDRWGRQHIAGSSSPRSFIYTRWPPLWNCISCRLCDNPGIALSLSLTVHFHCASEFAECQRCSGLAGYCRGNISFDITGPADVYSTTVSRSRWTRFCNAPLSGLPRLQTCRGIREKCCNRTKATAACPRSSCFSGPNSPPNTTMGAGVAS